MDSCPTNKAALVETPFDSLEETLDQSDTSDDLEEADKGN
jgi:hypothetical protein